MGGFTMSDNSRIPEERPSLEELTGALRQAVELIRAEPIPPEAVARATDRARQVARPAPRYPRLKWAALLAVAVPAAAALMVALLWPDQSERRRNSIQVVDDSNEHPRKKQHIAAVVTHPGETEDVAEGRKDLTKNPNISTNGGPDRLEQQNRRKGEDNAPEVARLPEGDPTSGKEAKDSPRGTTGTPSSTSGVDGIPAGRRIQGGTGSAGGGVRGDRVGNYLRSEKEAETMPRSRSDRDEDKPVDLKAAARSTSKPDVRTKNESKRDEEGWGSEAAKDRKKALDDLTRRPEKLNKKTIKEKEVLQRLTKGLPEIKREQVQTYLLRLSEADAKGKVGGEDKNKLLKELGELLDDAGRADANSNMAASLTARWNEMSGKDRQKAVDRLTEGLQDRQRQAIHSYFKFIGEVRRRGKLDEKTNEKLIQDLEGKLRDPEASASERPESREGDKVKAKKVKQLIDGLRLAQKDSGKNGTKDPYTWRLNRGQPTFARVYIGNGNSLDLVSLHVSVTIEGGRARTLVDHIFHNPHGKQLEGTFEYPLPTAASPSYFAMFLGQTRDTVPPRFGNGSAGPRLPDETLARLTPEQLVREVNTRDWGTLQEARLVSKQKALESYEEVVRGRVDPALLEYAAGNTFRGRVFPIPAKGYNRVLIAYEELLPFAEDKTLYRFPLPDRKLNELRFTLQVPAADCKEPTLHLQDKKGVKLGKEGSRLVFTRTWSNEKPEGDLAFTFTPPRPDVQVLSGRQDENGPVYVYTRIRPDLKKIANGKPFASHAVFLLDTSQSEYPGRFDDSMKLLQKILAADPDIKHFNILTFNVAGSWVEPSGWLENTTAGRKKALARLDGILLEGATDLSAALDMLARPSFEISSQTPVNVFLLSDGQITWGESNAASLVARFERRCAFPTQFNCYRTGVGAENLELYQALIRRGGGIFNCFTEEMMKDAATAHRRECLHVERVRFVGGPEASDVLVAGRQAAVFPGGELIIAARMKAAGKTTVLVEGTFQGKKFAQEYPVEIKAAGELAPRGWAEIAVASLLALNDSKLDSLVTAYCQKFGIASRVASFLILENDNDYKRFNLEQERGKTLAGDMARFLEEAWKNMGQIVSSRETFERFLAEVDPRVNLLAGPNGKHVRDMLALLNDKDFELPEASLRGAILKKSQTDADYLAARDKDRRNAAIYLTESRRRLDAGDVDGAIRVLSSVIEEFPARGDALRLVGYRLLDLSQAAQAVRLFQQVQKQRPFEPHSYRDLARSLEESGRYALAAIQYEVLLAGTWHNRFGNSLQLVGQEEYARMMQEAIRSRTLTKKLADHFGERLEHMSAARSRADLRVTISWNTDATDVDLWVIEPDGTKCFYQNTKTPSGGQLSQDQTQGYGPERYQIEKAKPGVYTVIVHYYRPNQNLLAGETHVNVVVTRSAGTADEKVERKTVILKKHNQEVEVFKVKF
jgi:tetratricopeptide (TPR) repeat protein